MLLSLPHCIHIMMSGSTIFLPLGLGEGALSCKYNTREGEGEGEGGV